MPFRAPQDRFLRFDEPRFPPGGPQFGRQDLLPALYGRSSSGTPIQDRPGRRADAGTGTAESKTDLAEALLGVDPQQTPRENCAQCRMLREFVAERYFPYRARLTRKLETDETVLRIHILPKLGALALDEIKTEAISDLINRMREDGYASGTMNRVIVILRYIYNLARKWKVPGGIENPAAGLSAGPEVQRNRFLSEEEAEASGPRHPRGREPDGRPLDHAAASDRRRRNEITHAKWDYVDWKNKTLLVPKSKSGRARVIALNQSAIALLTSTPRIHDNPYIFPVARHRPAFGFAIFSVGSHPQACRTGGCPAARFAAFVRELPRQPRRFSLRRAGAARPFARTHDAALRAFDT